MNGPIKRLVSLFSPRPDVTTAPGSHEWVKQTESFSVELGGGDRYELVYDSGTNDPIVRSYLEGYLANDYLADVFRRFTRPGDCVLDLGAHVGTFSLMAAASGHRVVAVDASPIHVELLRRSVAKNGFQQMEVVHTAVGERGGTVRFHVAGLWGMVAQPGHELPAVKGGPIVEVPAIRGDKLLRRLGCKRVDFIKMDIEGSEVAALRGLKPFLKGSDAPVIVYECNGQTLPSFGYTTADLRRTLEGFGYRTYRAEDGRFRLFPSDDFQPEMYLDLVALKPRHEQLVAREIGPPLGTEELIRRTLEESLRAHEVHRAYIARALSSAPLPIVGDPRVQSTLERLAGDTAGSVRDAAAWWTLRQPRVA